MFYHFELFLPCSTTSEENSSLTVRWEQLESCGEGRGSRVEPMVGLAPCSGSVPTAGRRAASNPTNMDTKTGNRSILSSKQDFQDQPRRRSIFRSTASKTSPYCEKPEQRELFLSAFSLHGGGPGWWFSVTAGGGAESPC